MTSKIEDRLKAMGYELPAVPKPMASYVPAKKVGDLVFCSGQGPTRDGKVIYEGCVGDELSEEEGYEAARLCAINLLAAAKSVAGSLDDIEEIVQVRGFVSSAEGFFKQPAVVNGASDLFIELFGERGQHARAALGTSALPNNIPVEVEMIARVK